MEVTGNQNARIPYVALALLCSEQGDRWMTKFLPLVESTITYKNRNKVFISRKNGQETKVTVVGDIWPHVLSKLLEEVVYRLDGEVVQTKEYVKAVFDDNNSVKINGESLILITSGTQQMDALALLIGSVAGAKRKVFKFREDLGNVVYIENIKSLKYTPIMTPTSSTKSPTKSPNKTKDTQLKMTLFSNQKKTSEKYQVNQV